MKQAKEIWQRWGYLVVPLIAAAFALACVVTGHPGAALLASGSVVVKPNSSYPQGAVMDIMQALQEGMIQISDLTQNEFRDIKGKLKRVRDDVLYHFLRLKAATVWVRGDYALFQDAAGTNVQIANDAATRFQSDLSDTNLTGKGGSLTKGTAFVIQSIQAPFEVPVSEDTTPLAGGDVINPTPVAAGANGNGAAALANALRDNVIIQFIVDDAIFEDNPIKFFPSDFSMTGSTNGANDGFVSNGVKGRWLSRVRHLDEQQPFTVNLKVVNDITVTRSMRIGAALVGVKYSPVVG